MSLRVLVVAEEGPAYFLTRRLRTAGHDPLVIHESEAVCARLAGRLRDPVICGDATDPRVLEDAGARTADVVMALTPSDPRNLAICQQATLHFHVPRALAVANDPDNEAILSRLGIEVAFSPTRVLASLVEQRASFSAITNLTPVADGRIHLTEIRLPPTSPVVGRRLSEARLPAGAIVAYLLRDADPIVPGGETVLLEGDRLMVVTLPGHHTSALAVLTGEPRRGRF